MRVLQITPVFGSVGGIESYVARSSEHLASRGHAVAVATETEPTVKVNSYKIVCIPGTSSLEREEFRKAKDQVLHFADSFQPDVILTHGCSARLLLALNEYYPTANFVHVVLCAGAKLFRNTDQVCSHPIGPRCLVNWYTGPCGSSRSPVVAVGAYLQAREYVIALKQLPRVIVASEFMHNYLVNEGVTAERISVVSDLDLGLRLETKGRRVSHEGVNILFVGRVVYGKGVQYAIRALTLLNERYRLTVVGDGWYLPELKQLTQNLDLNKRVKFTGFLQGADLEEQYQQATMAIVPSLAPEGAGLVVPEARRRGLPVVCFNAGGLAEWAQQYHGVYVADHADVKSLSRSITEAASGKPTDLALPAAIQKQPVEDILRRLVEK